MATHRNSDFNLNRNSLIKMALDKIGGLNFGEVSPDKLAKAIEALNLLIAQEELQGSLRLWAMSEATIQLQADGFVYTTNSTDELRSDIIEIVSMYYRDSGGDDIPMDTITTEQYEALSDKNQAGVPERAYLKRNEVLSEQILYLDAALSSVNTTSVAVGSDGEVYRCTTGHTSATINKPITGSSYRVYWQAGGSGSTNWATGTEYTNGELIRYAYKRPLLDFDNATDNPDMPRGWSRYLMWRLAHDLGAQYAVGLEERNWLKAQYLDARAEIFPSTRPHSSAFHNQGTFY